VGLRLVKPGGLAGYSELRLDGLVDRTVAARTREPVESILWLLVAVAPWASVEAAHVEGRTEYRAPLAGVTPVVDDVAGDAAWSAAPWHEIDQLWLGREYAAADFRASHNVVWTLEKIYMLVELVDDILLDRHRDPLLKYWDDDCLEIFIDESFVGSEAVPFGKKDRGWIDADLFGKLVLDAPR
jgi:Carbohydrate family 9 binding domain-like